jgi:type IV pilus assembly protein PilC
MLRQNGHIVLAIKRSLLAGLNKEISMGSPVKLRDLTTFCRQMATLTDAGVPLMEAVTTLADHASSKSLGRVLTGVRAHLLRGQPLSAALSAHPKVFPPLFISTMRAGEASGHVAEVFDRLAAHYERVSVSRGKLRAALTYPIVVTCTAIGVTVFLLTRVIPTFARMFAQLNAPLPVPTRVVLAVSNSLVYGWYGYLIAIVAVLALVTLSLRVPGLRKQMHRITLRIPIFGLLLLKSSLARLTRTLATLLESAISLVEALRMSVEGERNLLIVEAFTGAAAHVERGESLSAQLAKTNLLPPMVVQMMRVGEESGAVDAMLERVADYYDAEVEATVDQMKSLIEPLLVVVLAVIVGTVVASVILPMFSILNYIH